METARPFLTYLRKFVNLTDDEFTRCIMPISKIRRFGKKEFLTRAGEVEDHFNFIIKGLVRKYYKKNSHEINTQISMEGHIILSQESFHSRTPSEYFVETIEPSIFISIQYDDLEQLYSQSKKMEHLGRLVITHTMMLKDRWQMQMVKMTPRERFLNFVMKNPDLLQRVPQKYLASYLNIKPETFSRFKHLLRSHSRSIHPPKPGNSHSLSAA
ncbi:MAG: Crp/Fnr family transcriptional regulator [Bacteroidetes bacterium]|jgi:CRP-like cAMP-binding protein|nr:MAG: Crp/Fnr family transcriptional regulator [Bacteroidota bacterium]